jgi:hypothetical protein
MATPIQTEIKWSPLIQYSIPDQSWGLGCPQQNGTSTSLADCLYIEFTLV